MPAKVLVVGGAGYVGSATCAWLIDHGHKVWILDDLSTGHQELALGSRFVLGKAGDRALVTNLLSQEQFDCVMHFAAKSLVPESFEKPDEYYENNVLQTTELLETMLDVGIRRFIFSSTCSIFGNPGPEVISESLPRKPMNPYGATKLEIERRMEAMAQDRGLEAIALRYFNAAGAEPQLRVGEWHDPESHLIPRILASASADEAVEVYGTNYPTPDGTCIRDYIHVTDLAAAHEAAMNRLLNKSQKGARPKSFEAFNLGSEKGYSVREVISTCEAVVGKKITTIVRPPRQGDPPRLIADSGLAKRVLGFAPRFELKEIVESAWNWQKKRMGTFTALKPAIFLDRDGTLNEDPGYIGDPSQLMLFPGVSGALVALKKAGFELVIVSNQSGVGRGFFTEEQLEKVHARLDELLAQAGAKVDRYQLCTHKPEDDCPCRKPKPKLILDAARLSGLDLSRSFMIGDKLIDLKTGRAAQCKGVALVRTGYGRESESQLQPGDADFVGDTLVEVAEWIIRSSAKPAKT